MISYLSPAEGPVVPGFESQEIVYAKDQPQYRPLRTLVSDPGSEHRVISRWSPTEEQRKALSEGKDIFLELLTFGNPLQPILMWVADDTDIAPWAVEEALA